MDDFVVKLPPNDMHGFVLRNHIRLWLADRQFSEEFCGDVLLVASELFSNAVQAIDDESDIEIHLMLRSGIVNIAVSNHGEGFDPGSLLPPTPNQLRGRGIELSRSLGALMVEQANHRTTVQVAMNQPKLR